MSIESILQRLMEQSITAAMMFIGFIFFAKWVKDQLAAQRESNEEIRQILLDELESKRDDSRRCFDLHESLRTTINNNTDALRELKASRGHGGG